jgi:G patch domain-containing protein 1
VTSFKHLLTIKMTENNVFFGTAFPQRTERDKRAGTSDSGQFIPVWKQEARDEQGRRRFHGAFTGGFSAGYYNTVGSKEGITE